MDDRTDADVERMDIVTADGRIDTLAVGDERTDNLVVGEWTDT